MNGLLQQAATFLKRNSSTILTCVGAVGVVATTVMAVKATPKALRRIEDAKETKGEDLTRIETVKAAAPAYIPTVVTGVSTLVCIFGANALNKRQQAALISAYGLLDTAYKKHKGTVEELFGEAANIRVREGIAQDMYEETTVSEDKQLFFDFFSMRYFESTMEDVLKAEYELNRKLVDEYSVTLNDFYRMLGLPTLNMEDALGWSIEAGGVWYGYSWIDFDHEKIVLEDGLECCVISMSHEPTVDYLYYQ